ncbi:MAG: YdiY family protein [Novosphingobium sp.]
MTLSVPATAHAELPPPVRAMIDAAIATGDADKVAVVTDLALQTNPDEADEIAALRDAFDAHQTQLAARAKAAQEQKIRSAGLLENWSGEGELGAFRATGNSSNLGLSAGIKLKREGIDWAHKFRALADYQRSEGETTREQFMAAYEPNYRLSRRLFAYGLAQYDRDRFQGFSARYSLSGGLGYKAIDKENMQLAFKAGPAWRKTILTEDRGSTSEISGLAAMDFDWVFARGLKFSQSASAFVQSGNKSITSLTALEAQVNSKLKARLSYQIDYDSAPPAGAVKTDTLSRMTLVYGF